MKHAVEQILTIYRNILLPYAEGAQYGENWGAEFVQENADKSHARNADIKVDFSELTSEEATLLGFPLWDESGVRLVPLWLYDHMAIGQDLVDINGATMTVTAEYKDQSNPAAYMDNDHRGGATAWGFMPLDLRIKN